MKIIGLTGGIATGKTNISNLFKSWGVPVIDADEISKKLTEKNGKALKEIEEVFGKEVFDEEGNLDRKRLGNIIFTNEKEKTKLNQIIHPLVQMEIKKTLNDFEEKGEKVVVIDVPLLFETGMACMADEVWLTYAPQEEQIRRLIKRNNLTKKEAMDRINSQWPTEKKRLLANEIIDTTGTKEETADYVKKLFSKHYYPL